MGKLTDFISGIPSTGLLGSALNLYSQGVQNKWQSDQATLQNKANMELAKYQFDTNKQMFNEANQYNSPMAQMQRYKQAGLNPNLIYGQGSPGNAPNVLPQFKAPEYEANIRRPLNVSETLSKALGTLSDMQTYVNQKKQGQLLDQNIIKATADAKFAEDTNMFRNQYTWAKIQGLGALNYLNYGIPEGNELYHDTLKSGMWYQKALAEMSRINTQVGLMDAQKRLAERNEELRRKEIEGYMTPLAKTLWNTGTTIGSGLVRGGIGLFSKVAKLKGISTFTRKSGSTINSLKQMHY